MALTRNTDRILFGTDREPPLALFEEPYFTNVSPTDMQDIRRRCMKHKFDVTVSISGKPIASVHKELFEVVSPIFKFLIRKNITDDAPGSNNQSKLPYYMNLEMEQDVFNVIRYFFNTDKLPQSITTKVELAVRVMETSFHYSIHRLMERTIALLRENIQPESAFKILQAARAVECSELEELALETIYRNPSQLLENEDFLNLGCYDVCRILSSDSLACKEADVFQAAYSWSLKQAKENPSENPSPSLKYYFSQVSTCIRFPLLSLEEFALQTAATGDLLSYEEMTKIFQYALLPEEFKSMISLKYTAKPRSYVSPPDAVHMTISTETQTNHVQPRPFENQSPPVGNSNPRKRVHVTLDTTSPKTPDICPPKVKRLPGTEDGMAEEDSDDDLFTFVINHQNGEVSTFEDAVRRYVAKTNHKENVSGIILSNFKIENNHKTIIFKQCNEVSIDAKCDFLDWADDSFFNFVSHFDPMRYILFDTSGNLPMTPENIWGLKQDIFLKFNGVIFLKVKHSEKFDFKKEEELVLNYMLDSKRIMSNPKFKPTVLALSNCEFSLKIMRDNKGVKDKTKSLEKLVLYRVWGDFTLEEILSDCPNLKELICWKHVPANWIKESNSNFSAPLTLSFSNYFATKHNIRKLAIYQTGLRFPVRCTSAATSVTELILDMCHCIGGERNANITDVFHHVFPNIRKLVLVNNQLRGQYKEENAPVGTPALINCVRTNISSLEYILVSPVIWGDNEYEDEQLVSFLQHEAMLVGKPKDLRLEKNLEGVWRGSSTDAMSVPESLESDNKFWDDNMEYDTYNLNYFYDSAESFEEYFKQGDNFPTPVLWT